MTNEAKILIEKAQGLSAAEREDILDAMLASLQEKPDGDVDQAWRNVIDERLSALDRGGVEIFDADEAIARLRSK